MKKIVLTIGFVCLAIFLMPTDAFAQLGSQVGDQLGSASESALFTEAKDPRLIAVQIINTVLTLLGIVFTVLIIVGGYKWMTAGGDEGNVKQARQLLSRAVIGLIIIVSAYAISAFVGNIITNELYGS